ncbi:MAG: MFS transporter [Formosimonas sp.]
MKLPFTVWGLTLAQALLVTGNILLVSVSALVGAQIAPSAALITLPVAMQFLGLMLVTLPAAHLMRLWGRKMVFGVGNALGVLGAGLAYFALLQQSFAGFCVATFLLGMAIGVSQQYRFAAVEHTEPEQRANAVSLVMGGGVLAAILGPNLAIWVKSDVPNQQYLNAFVALLGLYIVAFAVVLCLPLKKINPTEAHGATRSYRELFRQPRLVAAVASGTIGYAVMILLMTATPLAMMSHGFHFEHSAHVIQWHVLGMFVPSFVTGTLITRFGEKKTMLAGCALLLICQLIAQFGSSYAHFTAGLMLLGVGWNFTFIGATTLLTQTYAPSEKAKVQGINDFLIFSFTTLASLFSGYWQNLLGWQTLNLVMMPCVALAVLLIYRGFKREV